MTGSRSDSDGANGGGDPIDDAIAAWLEAKENDADLLPGAFAAGLPDEQRTRFLEELESLAALDRMATGSAPRDLPLRFGEFRVLGELGRGAMGIVYDAEQITTGARVALKVLHAHVADNADALARFHREGDAARSLSHAGIVEVFECGADADGVWLAMARVEGRSLQRLLAALADPRDVDHGIARRLLGDPQAAADTLAQVADALHFAHGSGVVHRDVKPANLMVDDVGRATVLDFGLASVRDDDQPALTATGDLLGTPLYMAPEQAVAARGSGGSCDVYSLGAVLYECICGQPPIAPGPLAVVIDSILNVDPRDPQDRRPGVPPELARIALQCLEKDPARRYASAADVAADLRRFVAGQPVQAAARGPWQRLRRAARKHPLVAVLTTVAVLLLGSVFATVSYGATQRATARMLERDADLRRIPELLGTAPERVVAFGGAALKFYARAGLGQPATNAGPGPRSENATQALAIAERLAREYPDEARVQRALAMALLDVGDDPGRTRAVLEDLLALRDATPGDRIMAAVFEQLQGGGGGSELGTVDATDPTAAFWSGLWHQHRQQYFAAIAAFDRAILDPDLPEERRYYALLHRGWCRTCPDVMHLERAKDDLLQAAALRPRYGTARLLWAALCCLDPEDDLSRPVAAVTEVLSNAPPWVTVLTSQVLLALAEAGTWQAGPVQFGAEFSPIAAQPIPASRAAALAGLALLLLDGVLEKAPDRRDAALLRVAGVTMTGRHAEALAACDALLENATSHDRAGALVQRARVHLAAGRPQAAREDATAATVAATDAIPAWRLLADICRHLGDRPAELLALERTITLLRDARHKALFPAVFPDGNPLLPTTQLRRAEALLALDRRPEAITLLTEGDFGSPVAGQHATRIAYERRALLTHAGGVGADALPALPDDSPLRHLGSGGRPTRSVTSDAAALARGWLPATTLAGLRPTDHATANAALMQPAVTPALTDAALAIEPADEPATTPLAVLRIGMSATSGDAIDAPALPLPVLLPQIGRLARSNDQAALTRIVALADDQLSRDPMNGEARIVRAAALFLGGQPRDALRYLDDTLPSHPDDLRGRYLQAAAAFATNDRETLRHALERGDTLLDPATLDGARRALPLPLPTSGSELRAALE